MRVDTDEVILSIPGGKIATVAVGEGTWDFFTDMVISMANGPALANFKGVLDGSGGAGAQLNTFGPVPASAVGAKLNFAFLLYYPAVFYPYDYVSNPSEISILP